MIIGVCLTAASDKLPVVKAVIYTRISRNPSRDELGVRRQEKECRELASRAGLDVVAVFADDDQSAYRAKRRPGYVQLLDSLDAVDVVLAWHPDRLTRHPRELEDLIDRLEVTGTTVKTVQTGEYDLGTPSGRMQARIVGAVARHESEHKSARLRSKHRELAEAGKRAGGGSRAYGLTADRTAVVPAEAVIVRELADRVLAGESVHSICTDLNERGVTTAQGRPWFPSALRNTLEAPRIAGLRSLHGRPVATADWPALLDEQTWRRVTAVLVDPARRGHRGRPPRLLTGLIRCGLCGHNMRSGGTSRMRRYVCQIGPGERGCGRMTVIAEPVEEIVAQAVVARLGDLEARRAAIPEGDDRADLADLDQIAARRAELAEMWGAGELSRADWTTAGAVLDRRQAEAEARIRAQVRTAGPLDLIADVGMSGAAWDDLTDGRRRALLAAVIDRVVIATSPKNGGRFDPARVSIEWRA